MADVEILPPSLSQSEELARTYHERVKSGEFNPYRDEVWDLEHIERWHMAREEAVRMKVAGVSQLEDAALLDRIREKNLERLKEFRTDRQIADLRSEVVERICGKQIEGPSVYETLGEALSVISNTSYYDELAEAIFKSPDVIRKKIMRATTDSNPAVDFETMGAGVQNLLALYQSFTGVTDAELKLEFSGLRYGDLKKKVAEAVMKALK